MGNMHDARDAMVVFDDNLKSVDDVIRILVTCVGGDGNLLLDVGPMFDGRIEPRQVDILCKTSW